MTIDEILHSVDQICGRYGEKWVLHGSYAKGVALHGSDLDLVITDRNAQYHCIEDELGAIPTLRWVTSANQRYLVKEWLSSEVKQPNRHLLRVQTLRKLLSATERLDAGLSKDCNSLQRLRYARFAIGVGWKYLKDVMRAVGVHNVQSDAPLSVCMLAAKMHVVNLSQWLKMFRLNRSLSSLWYDYYEKGIVPDGQSILGGRDGVLSPLWELAYKRVELTTLTGEGYVDHAGMDEAREMVRQAAKHAHDTLEIALKVFQTCELGVNGLLKALAEAVYHVAYEGLCNPYPYDCEFHALKIGFGMGLLPDDRSLAGMCVGQTETPQSRDALYEVTMRALNAMEVVSGTGNPSGLQLFKETERLGLSNWPYAHGYHVRMPEAETVLELELREYQNSV